MSIDDVAFDESAIEQLRKHLIGTPHSAESLLRMVREKLLIEGLKGAARLEDALAPNGWRRSVSLGAHGELVWLFEVENSVARVRSLIVVPPEAAP